MNERASAGPPPGFYDSRAGGCEEAPQRFHPPPAGMGFAGLWDK